LANPSHLTSFDQSDLKIRFLYRMSHFRSVRICWLTSHRPHITAHYLDKKSLLCNSHKKTKRPSLSFLNIVFYQANEGHQYRKKGCLCQMSVVSSSLFGIPTIRKTTVHRTVMTMPCLIRVVVVALASVI